ncbi:MAG: flagellar hook-basal body protein [Candidatus Kapaibacterium sp.]
MLKEIFTAALSMHNQQTKLEVTANNLSNANTLGYKRAVAFERNLIDARANFYNTAGDVEQNDSPVGSYYDLNPGAMQQTENPFDLAIDGNGYFVLQDEDGREYLTRSGNFKLSSDGTLTAMDGKFLMGHNGPVNIMSEFIENPRLNGDTKAVDIKINEHGEVYANDFHVGDILLADCPNPITLQRVSKSLFFATKDSEIDYLPMDRASIRQGWLENSNVDVVQEMIEMIELQRMYEAGSKIIRTNDDTLDRSIGLGRYF